jgi:SAM-dependent methyltransferase
MLLSRSRSRRFFMLKTATNLLRVIKPFVPHRLLQRIRYRGSARYCPVCRSHVSRFLPHGNPPREDARCPVCASLERHRLLWLYLRESTNLFDGRPTRVLHAAPEPQLSRLLRHIPGVSYLSIDLAPGKAMLQADLTRLKFMDDAFDVIFCSHVLEHIPDNSKAMRELRRVLRPTGWAILQVPIRGEITLEDPSITSEEECTRLFDGADFRDRLASAGFHVKVDAFAANLPETAATSMGIRGAHGIHVCRKRTEAA